jgi:hypothetical protein
MRPDERAQERGVPVGRLRLAKRSRAAGFVLLERATGLQQAARHVGEVVKCSVPSWLSLNSSGTIARTGRRAIPASMNALVFRPTTAALCASESK